MFVPNQTINLEGQNLGCELVKVSHFLIVDFHIEHHDRLGHGLRFLGLGLDFGLRFLLLRSSRSCVLSEGIKIVFFGSFLLCFFLFSSFLFLLGLSSLVCGSPSLDDYGGEGVDEEVPEVEVGVGLLVGEF